MLDRSFFMDDNLYSLCTKPVDNLAVPGDGVELKRRFYSSGEEQSGGGWKEVVTYPVKVDEVRQTKHHVELASMGYFDFSGQVEVSVTYNKGEVKSSKGASVVVWYHSAD